MCHTTTDAPGPPESDTPDATVTTTANAASPAATDPVNPRQARPPARDRSGSFTGCSSGSVRSAVMVVLFTSFGTEAPGVSPIATRPIRTRGVDPGGREQLPRPCRRRRRLPNRTTRTEIAPRTAATGAGGKQLVGVAARAQLIGRILRIGRRLLCPGELTPQTLVRVLGRRHRARRHMMQLDPATRRPQRALGRHGVQRQRLRRPRLRLVRRAPARLVVDDHQLAVAFV